MRFFITVFLMLFASVASGDDHMLKESAYAQVKQSIGKGKPYFLEVGSDSCHSCKVMSQMLYEARQKHPGYNISFINVKKERDAASELHVMMIPTQIIYDGNGKEVYRHIGVLSEDELAALFTTYMF
ncbi:thioredoxin family protein [Sulfurovum mangrovi]|uniref:thioredoxin family protein n=1 Tax=Sulfurovum mangrovi TaxID=2893889 RepID=UPI001E559C62|nr:thioredoxin family protein [Sulfurovum mangrovi]UFH60305.1 thioredoxin family protein [Sulfurovum mangrovi]